MIARRVFPAILAVLLVIAAGGCSRSPHTDAPGDITGSLTSGGTQRTYLLHLPSRYQRAHPVPLLIALHGFGDTGSGMAKLTDFDAFADAQGFLVAYPDGVQKSWADGNNTNADQAGVDDVAFISALIDHLAATYTVDRARVYLAGMSNGGFMTMVLACALPEEIAAVAAVAATMPTSLVQHCQSDRPMPLLLMHGQSDPLVPAGGGAVLTQGGDHGPVLSDMDTVAFWVNRDACALPPAVEDLPARVNDGTQVRQTRYTGCRENTEVVYDAIAGAGHIWPGGPQYLPVRMIGKTTQNLDGSATIWAFFATHSKQ